MRIWLERHRFPEWAASVILLLAAYLVLGLLTLALIVSVAQLAELLPQYEAQLTAVVEDAGNTLRSLGVQQEQINAVVKAIDPGQLVAAAGAVLASTLGVLSNVFFLIVLLFFMVGGVPSGRWHGVLSRLGLDRIWWRLWPRTADLQPSRSRASRLC